MQGRDNEKLERDAQVAFWVVVALIGFLVFSGLAMLAGWITVSQTY